MGTINLIEATKNKLNQCTLVMITTDKVYENNEWIYGYREIDPLGGFDPYSSAVVLNYEGDDIPANVNGQAIIKLKEENKIEINCQSETGGLLVVSETYYKPGWKAFVNGIETKI